MSDCASNTQRLSRRVFVEALFTACGSLAVGGCGGGGGGEAAAEPAPVAPSPAPITPTAPVPPAPPAPPATSTTSTLIVRATTAGTMPFAATVLPMRGQVPSGATLVSPDDGALVCSVLSRWDDGSASVVVAASHATLAANEIRTLRLQNSTAAAAAPDLTPAAIAARVTSVDISFGALGAASIRDFSAPERIWWANAQTICARYRLAAPGHATLEAVIDIHAWSSRALVEVVVENAKMATTTPVKPGAASYTGATVSINGGAAIATVNSSGMPVEAAHSAFRAWYAAGWVGGDPGVRVTQAHAELQQHPLLFKCDQPNTADLSSYASDSYAPWSAGRYRSAGMGGGGDHPQIGPLPKWETRALQSGDVRAWRATEASALAFLGYACQYRDSGTGSVPTFAQLKVKNASQSGYSVGDPEYWPSQAGTTGTYSLEVAHHPAVGLMAFVARPSPVFIELAQKLAVWNGTWSVVSGGPVTKTGVFGRFYQLRGRAWCMRSLAHAIFVTPDAHPWKESAKVSISDNVAYLDGWRNDSKALLNTMWDETPVNIGGYVVGARTGETTPALGSALWMYHYLLVELHKVASAKLLSGAPQTALDTLADWCAMQPVRWVNEQTDGSWRYIAYTTTMGRNANTVDSLPNWGQQMDWWHDDAVPTATGSWFCTGNQGVRRYALYVPDNNPGAAPEYYTWYFWSALVAAVERNVPGATQAWATVQAGVTNLATWRAGFATEPRWGSTPRNI